MIGNDMYMVHKFQDRFARQQAVHSNTRTMIKRYVHVEAASVLKSGPGPIDIQRDAQAGTIYFEMLRETDVLIDAWMNEHSNPTLDDVCAFSSSLVEDFAEDIRERLADVRADRAGKA